MSAAVRAISSAKKVSFNSQTNEEDQHTDKNNKDIDMNNKPAGDEPHLETTIEDGHDPDDDEDDLSKLKSEIQLHLGPQFSIKEQLEKDKVCISYHVYVCMYVSKYICYELFLHLLLMIYIMLCNCLFQG